MRASLEEQGAAATRGRAKRGAASADDDASGNASEVEAMAPPRAKRPRGGAEATEESASSAEEAPAPPPPPKTPAPVSVRSLTKLASAAALPSPKSPAEEQGGCARSIGYSLVERYRQQRAESVAMRATLTNLVMIGATPPGGHKAKDEPQSGSTRSRGDRREYRRLATTLGDFGDALAFNDLSTRKKKLKFAKSGIHSWGLYALEPIEKEDFVVEYMGEYIRNPVAEARQKRYERQGFDDDYIFRVDADLLVDATRRGGLARFANHCCDPNCYSASSKRAGSSGSRSTRSARSTPARRSRTTTSSTATRTRASGSRAGAAPSAASASSTRGSFQLMRDPVRYVCVWCVGIGGKTQNCSLQSAHRSSPVFSLQVALHFLRAPLFFVHCPSTTSSGTSSS